MMRFFKSHILTAFFFIFAASSAFSQTGPELTFKPITTDLPYPGNGTIERYSVTSETYIDRYVDIWLPENYPGGGEYNVLYMHDGQMLFDPAITWNEQAWNAGETMQRLMDDGVIEPAIIVGIWNSEEHRHAEYFPERAIGYLAEDHKNELSERFPEGALANRYLQFLTEHLVPFVEAGYAVKAEREGRFLAGSSMGGLISIYAVTEYPDLFAGAACLSTHWIGTFEDNDEIPLAIRTYLENHLPAPGSHRLYFDHGTETLDALYPRHQKAADELFEKLGFTEKHYHSVSFPGTDHSERAWSARFDVPVRFLMGI